LTAEVEEKMTRVIIEVYPESGNPQFCRDCCQEIGYFAGKMFCHAFGVSYGGDITHLEGETKYGKVGDIIRHPDCIESERKLKELEVEK
jgi:hypothetical protein